MKVYVYLLLSMATGKETRKTKQITAEIPIYLTMLAKIVISIFFNN